MSSNVNENKYKKSITYILSELDNIQVGNFFEVTSNPNTPSAQTIAIKIKKEFTDLINNIKILENSY